VTFGLVVSGTLDLLLAPGVSAPTGESRTPTEPQSGPDPNVVLVDAERESSGADVGESTSRATPTFERGVRTSV
jgi:hypothetical protein